MDAANVDLKAFTDEFYVKLCGAHLQPVLDTLVYLKHETDVLVRDHDAADPRARTTRDAEIEAMSRWIVRELGPDVPLHFTAFHPDYKMTDLAATPPATLTRAREIALRRGLSATSTRATCTTRTGGTTFCPGCAKPLDRPRLARDPRLRPHRRRALPALRDGDPGPVRALRRRLRIPAHPDPDECGGVSRAAGPGIAGRRGIRWSWRFLLRLGTRRALRQIRSPDSYRVNGFSR